MVVLVFVFCLCLVSFKNIEVFSIKFLVLILVYKNEVKCIFFYEGINKICFFFFYFINVFGGGFLFVICVVSIYFVLIFIIELKIKMIEVFFVSFMSIFGYGVI